MHQCPEILIETIVVIILFTSIQSIILVVVFFRWKRNRTNGAKVESYSAPRLVLNDQVRSNLPNVDEEYAQIDYNKKNMSKRKIPDPILNDETYMNTQRKKKTPGPGEIFKILIYKTLNLFMYDFFHSN